MTANVRARAPRLIGARSIKQRPYAAPSNECARSTVRPFRSRQPTKSGLHYSGLCCYFSVNIIIVYSTRDPYKKTTFGTVAVEKRFFYDRKDENGMKS